LVDSRKYNEWFDMARKDMRSAGILFEHEADNEIICFHCQQTIEKYLKGYIIYSTGELKEGHSLLKLCKYAASIEKTFNDLLKDMAFVNTFYIETRYPAEDPLIVNALDVEECLKIMREVVEKIDSLVDVI
jgi:HEPN domain-containing protein